MPNYSSDLRVTSSTQEILSCSPSTKLPFTAAEVGKRKKSENKLATCYPLYFLFPCSLVDQASKCYNKREKRFPPFFSSKTQVTFMTSNFSSYITYHGLESIISFLTSLTKYI